MSFYLIKIDTMFFKGCFDIRVNMHLLPSDYTPYSKMAANKLFFCLHVN